MNSKRIIFFLTGLILVLQGHAQDQVRQHISLNAEWRTIANDSNRNAYDGFEKLRFDDTHWEQVAVPHNWDKYEGYRRLKHGNRHGYAWYRKTFSVDGKSTAKRYFLWFEGVGSYATIWLNGKQVGYHAGGRTTFTIDITEAVYLDNQTNILAVRADHPAFIRDLPWVCGGCSEEVGFSEGSQPMGIFRPVHLIITDPVRIEPFGVHVWNDTTVSERSAVLHINTEVKNYDTKRSRVITLVSTLLDKQGNPVAEVKEERKIPPGSTVEIRQQTPVIPNPHLWSLDDPYCYTLQSRVMERRKTIDQLSTVYGIRWIRWPVGRTSGTNQFFLNGKPVFINGTAEYEHRMGRSHAFTTEQIKANVMQIKAAGFNAFRDAHQPHNMRYHQYWDELGLLWWTQMAAHIWFDTPEFRDNFKTLLRDWVKERRNSPSLVLWGLENESTLPEDFARECTELIRSLDPTTSTQRKVTTCNGGEGTDWDVPQNWTGTYGGNPETYAEDIRKQVLIGEYGAWRSLGFHAEEPFTKEASSSEERMTTLMETKIRLGESAKANCSGHFHWLFTSHENPGRVQGGEGIRELDRVGPVNYKGLMTPWGEPLDAFYMYRSNYAPKETEPMVYIASHTWPDRWVAPGKKNNIVVYSNCDEVELFNDVEGLSLGKREHQGIGTHFQWDDVDINYNVLYAKGYVNGKEVAQDVIVLHHLPRSPSFNKLLVEDQKITAPQNGLNYLYRVNCGGPEYIDQNGNTWMADAHKNNTQSWGSTSWTDDFEGMPPFYASQRKTHDPISGTPDWSLFQHFRYGMDKLQYDFPVPNGTYWVELYFTEPWYGTGGGMDCSGWRLFDAAINNKTVLKNLDIWAASGHDGVLKKRIRVEVSDKNISVSFPHVAAGQAIISAIAIATDNTGISPVLESNSLIDALITHAQQDKWSVESWLSTGDKQYADDEGTFCALPSNLYGAEWIRTTQQTKSTEGKPLGKFQATADCDVYIAMDARITKVPEWLNEYEDTRTVCESASAGHRYEFMIRRKRFPAGTTISLGNNGSITNGLARMYSVMVLPVSTLQPAIDLRPVTKYKIEQAVWDDGIITDTILEKSCVTFEKDTGSTLTWNFSLGVANLYALRFRYFHTAAESKFVNVKIIAADGSLMNEEVLEFHPVNEPKWKTAHSSTGTMINAGNYKVVLTAVDAAGLSIRELEVQ